MDSIWLANRLCYPLEAGVDNEIIQEMFLQKVNFFWAIEAHRPGGRFVG
jgi:hypothetical protein